MLLQVCTVLDVHPFWLAVTGTVVCEPSAELLARLRAEGAAPTFYQLWELTLPAVLAGADFLTLLLDVPVPVVNVRVVRVSVGHRLVDVRMRMRLVEVRPGIMGMLMMGVMVVPVGVN